MFNQISNSDELQSKREWSVLQNLEVRYRDDQAKKVIMSKADAEYCAAGILADDGETRVWILANARYNPLVKILPNVPFHLSPESLSDITNGCGPTTQVLMELRSRLSTATAE